MFFVSVPCARLSWPSRQLLSACNYIVLYRIVYHPGMQRVPRPTELPTVSCMYRINRMASCHGQYTVKRLVNDFWCKTALWGRILYNMENLMWHRPDGRFAASCCAIPLSKLLTDFSCCLKRRSSDSHVFQWAQRPSKIAPSPGEYGPPSNSWFPGPTKVSPQMASWSV